MINKAKRKSVTFTDVLSYLAVADITADQHRRIVTLVNDRCKQIRTAAIRTLQTGDRVTWDSKLGYPITGTVTGKGRTRVYVMQDATCTRWSVSATLLRKL